YNNFFLNLKEKASPGLEEELKEEALKKRPRTEATSQLDVEELRDSKKHRFAVELSDIESLYEARIKDYQSLLKTLLEAAWSTFNINLQLIDKLKQPHEQYREAEVRLSFYQGLSKLNSVNPSEGLTKLLEDQHVLNQELLKREAELEQTGAGSPVLSNEKVSELSDAQEESGLETPRTQDTVHEERSPVGLSPEQAKQIRKQDVDKALADVESYLLLKANFKDPKPEEEILRMQREGKEGNFSIPLFRYLLIVELKNRFISGETSKENFAQELTKLANDSSMKPRSWYAKCVPWFTSTTHDKLIQAAKKWDKDHPQPR
ncbi:MAG: hypothetical protein EBX40_02820, partial [Gammaproteobacteria bacterium]|nr:hypothetical protein [Gammaproteobacteria bacterium]